VFCLDFPQREDGIAAFSAYMYVLSYVLIGLGVHRLSFAYVNFYLFVFLIDDEGTTLIIRCYEIIVNDPSAVGPIHNGGNFDDELPGTTGVLSAIHTAHSCILLYQ
jgi:hypothetical protein